MEFFKPIASTFILIFVIVFSVTFFLKTDVRKEITLAHILAPVSDSKLTFSNL